MISIRGRDDLHRIVVLNPKGGCGKTTLATNLASAYALRGPPPTLIDCDPQGYSVRWVEKRPSPLPEVYGIQGYDENLDVPEQLEIDVPSDSLTAIIDLPAAIPPRSLYEYTYAADSLLLPIQASEIDVHSATRFIAELLLDARVDRNERRLAIVANRVRSRTRSYDRLMRFLTSLRIPMIAALRDTQNYVYAAAGGIGVCEMPAYRVKQDTPQIDRIVDWLEQRRAVTAQSRTGAPEIAAMADRSSESRSFEDADPIADWLEAEAQADTTFDPEGS